MSPVRSLVLALCAFVLLFSLKLFPLKGYESGDDSGDGAHREGATEDPQENPNRCEKGRGIEHVCVRPSGLVGHNRPETSRKPQQPYRNGENAQQADGGEHALISGAISHRPPGGAASVESASPPPPGRNTTSQKNCIFLTTKARWPRRRS